MKTTLRLSMVVAAWLATTPVIAQTVVIPPAGDAGALQQRQIEEERRRREQQQPPPQTTDPVTRPAAPATLIQPAGVGPSFEVRQIEFTPSEILSAAELEAVAVLYRGKQLTLGDLQGLASKVNELYKARGMVTALAIIAPQDVSTGVIHVRLVEGRIGQISITGNNSTRESYIASRIGLKPGELVDLNRLEHSLVWFNQTNDVRLEVELKPGQQFGSTDVAVTALEPTPHEVLLTLDNLGSPLTGDWRGGASYRNRSLLGYRDDLSLSVTKAQGQTSQSVSYGIPLNIWGGRANLAYYDDKTAIKNGSLTSLNITGRSYATVLSLRQPVYVSNSTQTTLTGGAKRRESSNFSENVFLSGTLTSDANLGLELQRSDATSLWGASFTRFWGQSSALGNSTPFNLDRGSLRYNRDLNGGLSVHSNFSWQMSRDKNLVSGEQFFLGGEGSVRGYAAGAYSGDQGYTLNFELHHPIGKTELASRELLATGFVFVDHGQVEPFRPPNSLLNWRENITGIGWGLNATLAKRTNVRLTLGRGLDDVPLSPRGHYQLTLQLSSTF
jgi:hemolysin activation/secretion protein